MPNRRVEHRFRRVWVTGWTSPRWLPTLIGGWLLIAMIQPAFAQNPPAQDDSVAQWIEQLDAAQFSTRETATRRLIEAGPDVIEPIRGIIQRGNNELRSRGLFILKELAVNEPIDAETPARDCLENLLSDSSAYVQRRVRSVLGELDEIREAKTLVFFQELGAVKSDNAAIANQFTSQAGGYGLLLNERWRGKPEDLKRMEYLPNLVGVSLTGPWVDDDVVEILSQVKRLRLISLRKASITNRAPALLANLDNLVGFELRYCKVDDDCVEALRRFQFLARLILIGTQITPESARDLENLFGVTVVDYRRGGFLGVSCYTDNQRCVVMRVVEETGADELGIEVRDVITHVNDEPVTTSEELIAAIAKHEIGKKIKVTWESDGETQTGEVELGEYQDLE